MILLVSYATLGFPYGRALVVHAALILATVTLVIAVGMSRRGWIVRIRLAPSAAALGVALYAGAGGGATVVGLLRGNSPVDVAGQALSMGLLPLGAVAAWGLCGSRSSRPVAVGIFTSAAVATALHWVHGARTLVSPGFDPRLFMAHQVSPLGAALLAALFGLAVAVASSRWKRVAAGVGVASILVFMMIAATRSLWLVTPIGLLAFLALSGESRTLFVRQLLFGAIGVALALLALGALGSAWWKAHRANLAPDPIGEASYWRYPPGAAIEVLPDSPGGSPAYAWHAQPGARQSTVTEPFPVGPGRLYRLTVQLQVVGSDRGGLTLWLLDDEGRVCGQQLAWSERSLESVRLERVFVVPPGSVSARFVASLQPGAEGTVVTSALQLHDLGPDWLWPLYRLWQSVTGRALSLVEAPGEILQAEPSVLVRVAESRRLVELFADAPGPVKVLGHGLGARYAFEVGGVDDLGHRIVDRNPNYIHNFYAFLLFKTGIVGMFAVVAALLIWMLTAVHQALHSPDRWARLYAAALAAGLAAYALWSVACPEILDFRFAPLWGFALAGLCRFGPTRAGGPLGSDEPASPP